MAIYFFLGPNQLRYCNSFADYVSFMDDDLREDLHMEFAPCPDASFLREYVYAHYRKYGEIFNPFNERLWV